MTRIASTKKVARTTVAAGSVLAGCVLFTGTPALGAVAPESEPSGLGQPSQAVIDHYLADTTKPVTSAGSAGLTKAAIEHQERVTTGSSVPGVPSAQTKAQIEMLERAAAQQEAAATTGASSSSSDDGDDVSVPLTVLALLGGGLITGAAGTYTVYRTRHHGPVGAATA